MMEILPPMPPMPPKALLRPERSMLPPKRPMIAVKLFSTALMARLMATPTTPPKRPMAPLSARNMERMYHSLQPSTFITPISRVRS